MASAIVCRQPSGSAKPVRILGIDVTYLHSSHGADLARWFAETLELDLVYEDGHWFSFATDQGSGFGIDSTDHPRSVVEAQPAIISWLVEDIREAVEVLSGRGVSFFPSVDETLFDVGPKLVATFRDPDGNWHQLSQPKQRHGAKAETWKPLSRDGEEAR